MNYEKILTLEYYLNANQQKRRIDLIKKEKYTSDELNKKFFPWWFPMIEDYKRLAHSLEENDVASCRTIVLMKGLNIKSKVENQSGVTFENLMENHDSLEIRELLQELKSL